MFGNSTSWWGRLPGTLSVAKTPEGPRVVIWHQIAAPAERVWELLVDTRHWPEWGPSVLEVEAHPPLIEEGSTGRVRTAVGPWLPFTVTRVGEWSWAWRIGPVTATGHRVIPGDSSCRVGFEVPIHAAPYLLVCWWALRRIESLATAPETPTET